MPALDCQPNFTHYFLAELEKKGKLASIVTQNIDGLHQRAGSKTVREIHGSIMRNYCVKCGKEYLPYQIKGKIPPLCLCGGVIKPDVVLYGESIGDDYYLADEDIRAADMLIIGGTSLLVSPANYLHMSYRGDRLVLINYEQTVNEDFADLVIHDKLSNVFRQIKI